MIFNNPFFFGLLIFIPLIVFLYFKKKDTNVSIPVSFFRLAKKKMQISPFKKYLLFFIRILILIILIIIIARPQFESLIVSKKYEWVDIVLALDVSLSMLAEDMRPNRMEVAKDTIINFIGKLREWDRMSLVIFSWRPFTNVPLTSDFSTLKTFSSFLSTELINQNIIWLNWTWIWSAIVYSSDKFQEESDRERVLILMTDWESNRWVDPISATKLATDNNVKIYTIWIWKKEWAPVPFETQDWKREFILNFDWSLFLTKFDERSLQEIAEISWWKYFHADSGKVLSDIFNEIYSLEKRDILIENKSLREDIYLYFAFLALFLFLLENTLFLTIFRKRY